MKQYQNMTREELLAECRAMGSQVSRLKKEAMLSQELLDVIPTPVFIKDIEKTYLYCNAAFEKFIGLPKTKIVGRKASDISPDEFAEKYEEMDQRLIRDGGRQVYEYQVHGRNDELRLVRFHKSVYCNEKGDVDGIVGQIFDITELDNARNQAEIANQAKSFFLASMSHDLRTPLNGIMGAFQLLQLDKALQPAQLRIVNIGILSCRRLTELLSDILDLSKIEAGKVTLTSHKFSLKEVLNDMEQLFLFAANERMVRLSFHSSSNLPDRLIGDDYRLSQVLMNLISNAIKYSEDCEVRVEITATHYLRNKILLLMTVSDSGVGIDDEDLSTLFDMFSQVSTTSARQGAGLGLSIVKRLVNLMGGGVCVSSQKGIGTTFYVLLPFELPDQAEDVNVSAQTENPQKPLPLFKALIVEDDKISQTIISLMLQNLGGQADKASSGNEGLVRMRENDYDIVFMDIQLPDINGMQVTKMLRSEPEFSSRTNIPIIAMTANAMVGDRKKYLAAGMDDFIAKPVEMDKLNNTLEKYLHG